VHKYNAHTDPLRHHYYCGETKTALRKPKFAFYKPSRVASSGRLFFIRLRCSVENCIDVILSEAKNLNLSIFVIPNSIWNPFSHQRLWIPAPCLRRDKLRWNDIRAFRSE